MFPDVSVATQVTVVAPTGKVEPEGGLQTTDWTAQLSEAVGVKLTGTLVAIGQEAVAAAFISGHVIVGGVLSVTVTVKVQLGPS